MEDKSHIGVEAWKKATTEYIENTILIRKLSSTNVRTEFTEQAYYEELSRHFVQIRGIAEHNKRLLGDCIYPCLEGEELLSEELVRAMNEFIDQMIDGYDLLSLDTILVIMVAERLLKDAHNKQDKGYVIRQADLALIVYYTAYNMLNRTEDMKELRDEYGRRGVELAEEILAYADKERFVLLPDDECREAVLIDSRYLICFYESNYRDTLKCAQGIEQLQRAMQIAEDLFYHEQMPDYDWEYHRIRMCEYACTMTQVGNIKGLTKEQCLQLYPYARELDEKIWEDIDGLITVNMARLLSARVKFYAGKISQEEYLSVLRRLYTMRKKDSYFIDDVYTNLIIPVEYLVEIQKKKVLSEEIYSYVRELYRDAVRYISRTRNDETLGASLEYYADFLNHFMEFQGGMTFFEVVTLSMAGMHLPTYVHSNMVGKISLCIARHMLKRKPEFFLGLWGIESIEEVRARSREILEFIYRAGILHDAGKLFIIDTVFVYGRRLLDTEFQIIKRHPLAGDTLLRKYPSTRRYASLALAHHKSADNKSGYPSEMDLEALPERALALIIMVADSMDAATDSVGRSYGKGISLEQYIREVQEDDRGRYDRTIAELLAEDETLYRDLEFVLKNERQVLYYKSYDLMFMNFKEDEYQSIDK